MSKLENLSYEERLIEAAKEYVARRDRIIHPDGSFDKAGRWYPTDEETQECCEGIRSPSRAYPYSYMVHCRTIQHVAHLYGVTTADLKKIVLKRTSPSREGGIYYKAVAVVDGKFLSIYDGETEYKLGEMLRQPARQSHGGGYYVYRTIDEAREAAVPGNSKLKDAPRAIIKLECGGNYCKYDNGKISFSTVTPVEVVVEMVET